MRDIINPTIELNNFVYNYKDEFSQDNTLCFNDKLFREFVHSRCSNGVWLSEPSNSYLIKHTLNLTDNFGQWEKDLFFGHMKIYLKTLNDTKLFTKSWKTDKNKINLFEVKRIVNFKTEMSDTRSEIDEEEKIEEEDDTKQNLAKIDIDTFLRKFLVKHQRLIYEKQLRDQFNRMYINSLSDLITLPAHSWDTLQQNQNFGPIITPLLKKDIEQLRSGVKSNKLKKKTHGEILAEIHKIKRFLYYETKIKVQSINDTKKKVLIDQVAYLSRPALQAGFSEQKADEKFDGGPVMDQIQSYLEDNFATSDLSELVKPSHGMILVLNQSFSYLLQKSNEIAFFIEIFNGLHNEKLKKWFKN